MAHNKLTYVKKAAHILTSLVFALMAFIGIAMIALYAFGYRFYVVKTQSMKNIYPVGTLVLVDNTAPEDLAKGDVISFVTSGDAVVTHRVVENDTENEQIYTKGDMNNTADSTPSDYQNVLGKVVFGIPKIGSLAFYTNSTTVRRVIVVIICLLAAYLLLGAAFTLVRRIKCKRRERNEYEN